MRLAVGGATRSEVESSVTVTRAEYFTTLSRWNCGHVTP